MKKSFTKRLFVHFFYQKKLLRTMKLTLFFIAISTFSLFASNTFSQETRVSINLENAMIKDVLYEIKKQTNCSFLYNNSELNDKKRVTVRVNQQSVGTVLNIVLKDQKLAFEFENNVILIYKQGSNPKERLNTVQQDLKSNRGVIIDVGEPKERLNAVQQDLKSIRGVISDVNGEPIIGATVKEKNTTNGIATDINGNYSISVQPGATIVVSYVGYIEQEFKVTNQTIYNIVLVQNTKILDEVVVVGYGTQKKVNLTGAVENISKDDIKNRSVSDATNLLTGLAPGLTVVQSNGQPGADGAMINIRGIGTIRSSSGEVNSATFPLVIVDGVEGSMNNINPDDIENISVLKDASSAAIYGVKAANGVIIVTTKRGVIGRPKITYNGSVGIQNPTRTPKFLGSADYARLYNIGLQNDQDDYGNTAYNRYTAEDIRNFEQGTDPDKYPSSDWLNELFSQTAIQTNHFISLSGGVPKTQYALSFGYLDRKGFIEQTGYKKYSLRANLDQEVVSNLKIGTNLFFSKSQTDAPSMGVSDLIHRAYRESPTIPIRYSNGDWSAYLNEHNSVAQARDGGYSKSTGSQFIVTAYAEWKVIDGFKIKGLVSADESYYHDKNFQHYLVLYNADHVVATQFRSGLNESRGENTSVNLQLFGTYEKQFGKHGINLLLGYDQRRSDWSALGAGRNDLPKNNSLEELNAGAADNQTNWGSSSSNRIRSVFGRLNYNLADKYLLESNFRYDGSSRFPKDNRFAFFPSFSAGWRISEEPFFENLKETVNNLKIRASWGQLGNQEIGNYVYQNKYQLGWLYGVGGQLVSGIAENATLSNANITWEKSTMTNVGLDLNLFNDKLVFTADAYIKKTDNILLNLPRPTIIGAYVPTTNAGSVENKGIELFIRHNNVIGDFRYSIGGNFSYVKNEITDLKGTDSPGRSVGDPVYNIYGYEAIGIFQSEEEIKNAPKQSATGANVSPGDLRYKDRDGDNEITEKDRTSLGSYFPAINFGLQLSAEYKGFDFSALLQGAADVKGVISTLYSQPFANSGKVMERHLDTWTPDNTDAKYPRIAFNTASRNYGNTNSWFVEDASYLRARNVQLGYSLPKSLLTPMGIERLRVYFSGDNLFTITKFCDGFDPETPYGGGNGYPQVTTYSFGVNVTF